MNLDPNPLAELLNRARQALAEPGGALPAMPHATGEAGCVVLLAIGEDGSRARVVAGRGADVEAAWRQAAQAVDAQARRAEQPPQRLRAELVDRVTATTWGTLKAKLAQTKRNYFNEGIAFDACFETALLAQEINGSAILYNGKVDHAEPNPGNLRIHAKRRFSKEIEFPADDAAPVWCFTTRAVYVDGEGAWPLTAVGQAAGFRRLDDWGAAHVGALIERSSRYLAAQVKPTGEFEYGWFPCFDRAIPTYNTLRHASSTYALLEAWELTQDPAQKAAIDRALAYLDTRLIQRFDAEGGPRVAFLVDLGNEVKLGGNAVCLLAFVKYTELTGDARYKPLMEQLALGIGRMQDPKTGRFVHVLHHPGMQVKDSFRVIYYDGEAAFGLMRLYGLTGDPRWLAMVEKAFGHFIEAEHWRAHDHWLSYCVNELTRYRPEVRYYEFGLRNVAGYLDFVLERITTFPTLLELMMAAHEMVQRLDADAALRPLLAGLDRGKFEHALEYRARYLANGHFWPELAMFFRNPARIAGSFFIKHHSFRVRIDDVEHYLSGYVAYLRLLNSRAARDARRAPAEARGQAAQTGPAGASGTVAWGGDVNLGRRQHYRTRDLGGPHGVLGRIAALRDADLRIVNLECVVATTGRQGVDKDETGSYYYRARPEMIEVLTATGIDLVSTANNHSGDYGPEALMEQKALLDAAGIGSAGSGADLEAALRPVMRQAGHVRVALFSLDATQPQFGATATTPGAAYLSLADPAAWTTTLAPRIARAREQADVVLVAVHWGDNLETVPSQAEIAVGHAIVDAGADAILGASAHVLQGIEVYRGRPILHDAGDLLFDAMRSDFVDAGVFTLALEPTGVTQVRFTPIGVGFGFSEQYVGDRARASSERFAAQCRALGTETVPTPEGGCAVRLLPPGRAVLPPATVPAAPITRGNPLPLRVARPEWTVDAVPQDAVLPPVQVGPLRLLGVRCAPTQVFGRQLLWVESFWTADAPVEADLRVQFRAVPMRSKTMPAWGEGMDHDPCDWMWPTSRWQPGRIYRDCYGLRPPLARQLESDVLQLELRLRGSAKLYKLPKPRRLPVWCGLRVPGMPTPLPDGPAPVLAASLPGAGATPGPVWTAEQLVQVTGGTWIVAPPEGWSVQSVVRLPLHLRTRPRPALFVASDYATLAAHENFSREPETWDQHDDLQRLQPLLAGAIVQRPVPGLPPAFALLQVEDPIAALLALGAAARERFRGRVVGVTGTVGKSSTISMLRDLLPPAARVLTTIENNNSRVGVPGALASLGPDVDVCILEMAQSGLWMDRGPISLMARPHVAILTEVGLSQTVKADTLEKTADYKSRIFLGLEPGGVAVIGAHIPCLVQVVKAAMRTAAKVWTVGTGPEANVRLLDMQPVPEGCRVRIAIRGRTCQYLFPIASAGLVRNSALAFTALVAMGFDAEEACARMPHVRLPASVMQVLRLSTRAGVQVTLVDDSWNAEVMSMRNAMEFVRSYRKPGDEPIARRIGVLGRIVNLGNDAEKMHRSLAEPLLASGIDHVVTHGDEMRWLREEVPATLLGPHFDNADLLTRYLEDILRDGDLLLVKGDRDLSDFGRIPALLQKL